MFTFNLRADQLFDERARQFVSACGMNAFECPAG
jgi:hypothetical protein